MKIVIAGAGEVGSHLAKLLGGSNHDLTVIDSDAKLLQEVAGMADAVTIEGEPTTFSALKKASVRKADLFIAVCHDESVNILSAIIAKKLGARKCIARIDDNEYLEEPHRGIFTEMGIDYLFYPEKIAAGEVVNLLGHTSTTEYVDFADGRLSLMVFRLDPDSDLIGKTLTRASAGQEDMPYRTVAIERDGETIIPKGDDIFEEYDNIYVITSRRNAASLENYLDRRSIAIRNVMILGGSRIGIEVARQLEERVNVKLIEYNEDKAYKVAETLDKTLIIHDDGRDIEAMMEEGLDNMDAFIAVTGRSETNILTSMAAKKSGVKKVIAEIENLNYIALAESIGIDTVINKKLVTASNIFRFTMDSDVQSVKYLTGSEAEVLEFIVKADSRITRGPLREMGFPDGAIIGGIVRNEKVIIAVGDSVIETGDRVVVFALPPVVDKVAKFFN